VRREPGDRHVAGFSEALADGKLLLPVEDAARRLGIGGTIMYRLVSSGAVESVTLGRLRRIPSECLDEFVSALRRTQTRAKQATGSAA
jgi:excisionase family DNA binding protein